MTKITYLGPSSDHRTNRWQITCPHCGKSFRPATTLKSFRVETCDHCNKYVAVDYNEETAEIYLG